MRLVRLVLRSAPCFPLVVYLVRQRIKPLNDHPGPEAVLLVLDRERWWKEDLRILSRRCQLYELPSGVRDWISSLFFGEKENKCLLAYRFQGRQLAVKEKLVGYQARLLKAIRAALKIDCLVTTNHMYMQNKLLAEACGRSAIAFIDVHKECMKDEYISVVVNKKFELLDAKSPFMGSRICVYNHYMKEFLTGMGIVAEQDVAVIGALRIDDFMKRVNEARQTPQELRTVTLFSFRHSPSGMPTVDFQYQFSPDGTKGYAKLFDHVHGIFAGMAARYPHLDFVIKVKWKQVWEEYIRRAVIRSGNDPDRLPNLRIVSDEESAQDLIIKSMLVIGLNSTTILEGRIAGKPVIVPFFDEIADRYPETLVFRDFLSDFKVARSADEFSSLMSSLIENPPSFMPPDENMLIKYFGYTDGKSLDRFMNVVREETKEHAILGRE